MGQCSRLSALRQRTKGLPLQKRQDIQVRTLQKAIFGENGYDLRELQHSFTEMVSDFLSDFAIKERYQFH